VGGDDGRGDQCCGCAASTRRLWAPRGSRQHRRARARRPAAIRRPGWAGWCGEEIAVREDISGPRTSLRGRRGVS
jgi:hypothetical protein